MLKQHDHNPEASLEAGDRAPSDTIPGSSLSNIDEVETPRSLELNIKKLDCASEVASGVAGAADGVGEFKALDTARKAVTFTHDFLKKCQFVSDQLGLIVGTVDTIAEVRSFLSIISRICSR